MSAMRRIMGGDEVVRMGGQTSDQTGRQESTMVMSEDQQGAHDIPMLSLIIPAYNERPRLPRSLAAIRAFLQESNITAEVIVVDDGSVDGTADVVDEAARTWPTLRLVRAAHRGKGHAVRLGMLAANGRYSFICDADLSMPVTEIPRFLPPRLEDVDVAIATREGPGSRRFGEPWPRHLMGRVFNTLVRMLALPGIQDSQCGFKCLRADLGRRLAAVQTVDGWGFDVEMLYVARGWGYRVVEIPIDWYYAPSSRIRPLRDAWRMTRDVLRVRRNARHGLYDQAASAGDAVDGVAGTLDATSHSRQAIQASIGRRRVG